jgi:small redox-active disulfide protein 2
MKKIKIFGAGCPKCQALFENVQRAVSDLDIKVEVEKVTDIMAMAKMAIMGTPALVIDRKLKSVKVAEIKEILNKKEE